MKSMHTIDTLESEKQIQKVKETFLTELKAKLHLHQVFAPLYFNTQSGHNDDLNGVEKPVSFHRSGLQESYTVVHSLAKWKRKRLKDLDIPLHEGIVTNMIALRPSDTLSPIHSVLVDQWDWESHIKPEDRNLEFLKQKVKAIYQALKSTEQKCCKELSLGESVLPDEISFIHSEDLLEKYSDKSPKEREDLITKELGAVFLIGVGADLMNGQPHDGRAPDYDDWTTSTTTGHRGLNGDILVWNPVLQSAFEISSMGIRVDKEALLKQLEIRDVTERKEYPFHQQLIQGELPQSIGGGIGQSRVAMFMLRKQAISEVQYCEN